MRDDVINMSRARHKDKKLSPWQELNLWPSAQRLDALTSELRRTRDVLGQTKGSYMTYVLRTSRISNVEIVMCVINKEWW